MATLVHDDLLDGADVRRGRPTVWAEHGEGAAKAAGDYLFARAFAQLAETKDPEALAVLAEAALALARGEAMQRRQAFCPDTSVEEYLARCSLKTGKLFEAACLLGGNGRALGPFGLALGIAFQITDDILDCTGDYRSTGKAGGVDLATARRRCRCSSRRSATRRSTARCRRGGRGRARARGGDRCARRGQEVASDYAAEARAVLDGDPDRASLEALTHAVVDRER